LIARGCLITLFLVFVVLPVAGFAFALWVVLTPTSEETAAATAYRNAPACSSVLPTEQGCIRSERAEIVNYSWWVGRCGSHTDRFTLKLNDGLHKAEVGFDCLAANASWGSDGRMNVREYRGEVTTVYDVDQRAYETTVSPARSRSWTRGVAAAVVAVLGAWLVVVGVIAIGLKVTKRTNTSPP
jgi:hypothetical protein